jgi:hypothetical protein
VDTVIKRAMSKDPNDRYATCCDFVKALENACATSKGWQPLPPGSSQTLPTLMLGPKPSVPASQKDVSLEAPTVLFPTVPKKAAKTAPVAVAEAEPDQEDTPKALRILRTLAAVIVAAGVLSALVVFAYQYLEGDRNEGTPTAQVTDQTAPPEPPKPKPSPTGERVVTPPPPSMDPAPPKPDQAAESNDKQAEKRPDEENPPMPVRTPRGSIVVPAEVETRVVTTPPGATILIDNRVTCTSPCSVTLPTGRHTLAATLDGHRRGLKIFELPRESEVFVLMEQTTGTLMVRSDPAGANIVVDGQTRQEKTPAMLTLPVGRHRVEIVKEGFKRDVEEVQIKDSVITNIDVNWATTKGNQ